MRSNPKFSLCCMNGQVKLPLLKRPHVVLEELLNLVGGQRSKKFKAQIMSYNVMFDMMSMGEKVHHKVNDGRSPYIF
jgi:hypothetical protein